MEGFELKRIDDVAMNLASGMSRRNAIRAAAATLGGVVLAAGFGGQVAWAAKKSKKSKKKHPRKKSRTFKLNANGNAIGSVTPPSCIESNETCHSKTEITGHATGIGPIQLTSQVTFNIKDLDEDSCFPISGTVTFQSTKKNRRGTVTGTLLKGRNCLINGGAGATSTGSVKFTKGTGAFKGVRGATTFLSHTEDGQHMKMSGTGTIIY
jgi:hypothetical protein